MNELKLRHAEPGDIPDITRIYSHAVLHGTASYELDPPSESELASRFEKLTGAQYPWIVAENGDIISGYAYAGPFRPRRAYRFTVEDSVYIGPDAQGKGIGTMLLARLITEVTRLGFRQMVAVIGDGSHHTASIRLHQRAGFIEAGRLAGSGFKHGRWLDTVFMQLALNSGKDTPPDPDSTPERQFRAGNT